MEIANPNGSPETYAFCVRFKNQQFERCLLELFEKIEQFGNRQYEQAHPPANFSDSSSHPPRAPGKTFSNHAQEPKMAGKSVIMIDSPLPQCGAKPSGRMAGDAFGWLSVSRVETRK
ncbi:MAG: hypothetical protein ACRD3W_28940 [Terriglobales bacterium]